MCYVWDVAKVYGRGRIGVDRASTGVVELSEVRAELPGFPPERAPKWNSALPGRFSPEHATPCTSSKSTARAAAPPRWVP